MAHASERGYVPPDLVGAFLKGNGRRPSKVAVHRKTLDDLLGDTIPKEFWEARTVDRVALPLDAAGGLDADLVAARVSRDAPLSTIVMSEAVACRVHDLGLALAGRGADEAAADDFSKVDWGRLVGCVVPYVTQSPPRVGDSWAFNPVLDGDHPFAFRPVVMSTLGRPDVKGHQGYVMAQGVTVSARAFNYPQSMPDKRVSLGINPVFEETFAYVLITHAYANIPYASLNKATRKRGRTQPDDDPHAEAREARFGWEAYREANAARLAEPNYRIGSFGLLITKLTHKHVMRAMLPWGCAEVGRRLSEMRRADGQSLASYLVELPMTMAKPTQRVQRDVGGLDLRCMLLVERLLEGTPLAGLLTVDGRADLVVAAGHHLGSASAMHGVMKAWADRNFAPPGPAAPVPDPLSTADPADPAPSTATATDPVLVGTPEVKDEVAFV